MNQETKNRLIILYGQIAQLTLPKCKQCPVPLSCCSPEYCEMAIQHAKKRWDVELKPTGHPRLPMMGVNGCVASPHFRPLCSLHTCRINSLACEPDDPEMTERYFELRDQIEGLEMDAWAEEHPQKIYC